MSFPAQRGRRLRRNAALRDLARETTLIPEDLIAPVFVKEGIEDALPIASMPGIAQHSLESLLKEVSSLMAEGVWAFMLFGVPATKDSLGSSADAPEGIVQRAVRNLRQEMGDKIVIITDLCLDEYTDHGHCGLLDDAGEVDNDATLLRYRSIANAQAEAGADLVAPSGMMDGQVAAIRSALDDGGFTDTGIMSYASKFASALYGPFRDAAECGPSFGDREGYQMDPANGREAVAEALRDVEEGADIVMVKPAGLYLDVVSKVADEVRVPVAAYQVSGEYSMIKAAANAGYVDERRIILESLTSIKRAGAEMIVSYFAGDVVKWL